MHHSGSIGGPSLAQLEKLGVAMAGRSPIAALPAPISATWKVAQWTPENVRVTFPERGLPVAALDKTPAQIFDLFSTARSAPANTYYISPTGNDTTGTGASGAPWRSIHKAVTAANASGQPARVYVAAGDYPRANNPSNGNSVLPTVDIAFIATGGRVVTGTYDNFAAPAADATYPNTYSWAQTNVERVIDLARQDADGFHPDFLKVGSAAICNRTPGSWYTDGATIYVNRADGAAVTYSNTRMMRYAVANWRVTSPVSIYIGGNDALSGFDNFGGYASGAGFQYTQSAAPASMKAVVIDNATFRYCGGNNTTNGNGIGILGLHGLALFNNVDSSNNPRDGFSLTGGVSGAYGHMVTVNCRAIKLGNATGVGTANTSCNAWTLHNDSVGVDFAGEYRRGGGGTIRNIDQSLALLVGTTVDRDYGDALQGGSTYRTAVQINATAKAWLDRCDLYVAPGANALYADSTAAIYTRNMPARRQANAGAGIVGNW